MEPKAGDVALAWVSLPKVRPDSGGNGGRRSRQHDVDGCGSSGITARRAKARGGGPRCTPSDPGFRPESPGQSERTEWDANPRRAGPHGRLLSTGAGQEGAAVEVQAAAGVRCHHGDDNLADRENESLTVGRSCGCRGPTMY